MLCILNTVITQSGQGCPMTSNCRFTSSIILGAYGSETLMIVSGNNPVYNQSSAPAGDTDTFYTFYPGTNQPCFLVTNTDGGEMFPLFSLYYFVSEFKNPRAFNNKGTRKPQEVLPGHKIC